MTNLVVPEDGMRLTRDTALAPGVYYVPSGIEIAADNITLEGNGALLIGNAYQGRGVRVNQHIGVTLRNLRVERFYHGIWANAGAHLHIEHCAVARTHEVPAPDTFLDVWLARDEAYGGGIFLSGIIDSFVTDNDVRHQQNGIMAYGCNQLEIARNNASFNSGYGILLYESSENVVENNVADFCSRIYASDPTGGRYHNGADAAGLVLMCNSSKNIARNNMLRGGGDGVFLGGFHKDQIKVPCNDNLFENNDGSFSPNIAFEATFSQRNVFRNNRADNCNYGFWLGWSSETTVEGNSINGNRTAGISIEHGHHNVISNNTLGHNGAGVQLWVNADAKRSAALFRQFYPDCADSHETRLTGNTFTHNDIALHAWTERDARYTGPRCQRFSVTGNTLDDNRVGVQFERVRDSVITANSLKGNVEAGMKLIGCADVTTDGNTLG